MLHIYNCRTKRIKTKPLLQVTFEDKEYLENDPSHPLHKNAVLIAPDVLDDVVHTIIESRPKLHEVISRPLPVIPEEVIVRGPKKTYRRPKSELQFELEEDNIFTHYEEPDRLLSSKNKIEKQTSPIENSGMTRATSTTEIPFTVVDN